MKATKCNECPYKGQKSIAAEGNPRTARYILIGEAPSYEEVREGRPFVGKAGRLLNQILRRVDIDRSDCYITNAVQCQVPKDKAGIDAAVDACRWILAVELEDIAPNTPICVMGQYARDALFPHLRGKGVMSTRGWRGFHGHNVLCMAHPAFAMYNPDQYPMIEKDFRRLKRGRQTYTPPAYKVIDTKEDLVTLYKQLSKLPPDTYVAFDIETDQVDHQRDDILCMALSWEPGVAAVLASNILYDDLGRRFLKALFDSKLQFVAHNGKFDMRFIVYQLGVDNARVDLDTIVAHYALDERRGGHSLKALADDYLDTGNYEEEVLRYVGKKSGRYSNCPPDILYEYNATDADVTLRLAFLLEKELKAQGLWEQPFLYPLMAAVPMLLQAELRGIYVNWEELDRIDAEEVEPELTRITEELREMAGDPALNPRSSVKINDLLYDHYKFPIIEVRTRAAGKRIKARSSQRAVFEGWEKMWTQGQLPISEEAWRCACLVHEYRHVAKMRSSYLNKWRKLRGTDDRVHAHFLLRGTVTGRLSAKDPPVQTIPSKARDKWAMLISGMNTAAPGHKFVYADYSQAELRIAAALSNDEFMMQSFIDGADYHSEVARAAFGENYTKEDRTACKRLTFGWLYGGNAYEIAMKALQFEGAIAERFARRWEEMFGTFTTWRTKQGKKMLRQGYVESITGRRRRLPLITKHTKGKALRIAANMPIQSAASDLTLISAIELYRQGFHVALLIHDSIILEEKDADVERASEALERTMIAVANRYFPKVPFKADVSVGLTLADVI